MATVLRGFFLLVAAVAGYLIYSSMSHSAYQEYLGAGTGLAAGLLAILLDLVVKRTPVRTLAGGVTGLAAGIVLASLLSLPLKGLPVSADMAGIIRFILYTVLVYFGLVFGARKGKEFDLKRTISAFKSAEEAADIKLLDTSVIIDGRIADICETGFLEGQFVIPQFILHELQHIADSTDPLKRARGRRGLDVLHKVQKISGLDVRVVDDDFPNIREVDAKLVALAKAKNAKVVTNDYNLNKVAGLQGVKVLNINELSNAVKPVVLPGEAMRVFVLKEGKEFGQGVGYLDDGTMIVVENGRKQIGRTVDVSVTSVLQTTAGRMIFTRLREDSEKEEFQAVGAS